MADLPEGKTCGKEEAKIKFFQEFEDIINIDGLEEKCNAADFFKSSRKKVTKAATPHVESKPTDTTGEPTHRKLGKVFPDLSGASRIPETPLAIQRPTVPSHTHIQPSVQLITSINMPTVKQSGKKKKDSFKMQPPHRQIFKDKVFCM